MAYESSAGSVDQVGVGDDMLWELGGAIAVGARELVQVAAVPASERIIDRRGKLRKRMAARSGEHPTRSWPQGLTVSSDRVHANREPGLPGDRIGVSTRAPGA